MTKVFGNTSMNSNQNNKLNSHTAIIVDYYLIIKMSIKIKFFIILGCSHNMIMRTK